jgi:small subunit ribosomal protein S17
MAEANQSTSRPAAGRGSRRTLRGRVVSDTSKPGRQLKTVVVEVEKRFQHLEYGKFITRRKRYHAHDENHEYKTNDLVEIRESRPLSATKRWLVVRLIARPEEV